MKGRQQRCAKRLAGGLLALGLMGTLVVTASPTSAAPKTGDTEQCANGAVIVHSDGASIWAASGDAKYQLVSLDGTGNGQYLDKKTGELTPFSFEFHKVYGSGKKDTALTCVGHRDEFGPGSGEEFHLDFTAVLRSVQ